VGSLSQFEENVGPLLRGHLSAGKGIGGIGFFKGVKNADYFFHNLILPGLFNLFNFLGGNPRRRPVLPRKIESWSLTGLQQRLVEAGGRLQARPVLLV
jgi:hypothetical protein